MKVDIGEIQQEIEMASDDASRLALLLAKSASYYRWYPKEALQWSRQALKLAVKRNSALDEGRAYFRTALAEFQLCHYKKSDEALDRALRLFSGPEVDVLEICNIYFLRGILQSKIGKLRESIKLLREALDLAGESLLKRLEILTVLGNTLSELAEYAQALEYQYQALSLAEQIEDPIRRSVVLSNIGAIYLEVKLYPKAETFLSRSLSIASEIADHNGVVKRLVNLISLHRELQQWEEASTLTSRALDLLQEHPDIQVEAFLKTELGNIESERHNHTQSLQFFEQALDISRRHELTSLIPGCLLGYGKALSASGKSKKAATILEESVTYAKEQGQENFECDAYSELAVLYQQQNDQANALTAYKEYFRLNARVHSRERERSIIEVHAKAEIEKADLERARMEQLAYDAATRESLLRAEAEQRKNELTTLALQLVQKNEFLSELKEELGSDSKGSKQSKVSRKSGALVSRIDDHIRSDRDWETFEVQFNQVHHDFLQHLSERGPNLTPSELKIAALIKLNLTTKAIANLLCLSARTVENHRQSLRKKLKLPVESNLVSYLTGL